ncbi:methionine/alanine import family NSS transporter small subunit [Georgenia satyanarayanai]|uniref:methionine/alanine import family NSS transporter small subunit n=1 Tax=Georgenia satyanarayanai TaxID=860221 RepID=UPI00203DF946|nr:methionine/alanine import family NSS transporter small subunit [Georgenia satyanarayanai]MCM3662542.1 methionine/alanine import family NSS transporter small subunit [Georgenia satyanarayanai]
MTSLSIALMVISILIIWGGLAVAITFLVKHPLEDEDTSPAQPGQYRPPRR